MTLLSSVSVCGCVATRRRVLGGLGAGGAALLCINGVRGAFAQAGSRSSIAPKGSLVDDLVTANHILAMHGILDTYGHVSVRSPDNPQRYLMSRLQSAALVNADDIIELDLDSNVIDPTRGRGVSERFIHGEIYKARPDVSAVVHSHSAAYIPFSIADVKLQPVAHTSSFLWVGVPVFDIRDVAGVTDLLVRTPELGKALAGTLGDKPMALMRGHGSVIVGGDLPTAVFRAVYSEENARMEAAALSLGGPIKYISAEEGALRDKAPEDPRRAWNLWKSQLGTGNPR